MRNLKKSASSDQDQPSCWNDDHKVGDCPTIADRGREGKQISPNVPKDYAPNKRRFYELRTRGSKPDDDGYFFCFIIYMISL